MPWKIQLSYVPYKIQTEYFRMQVYGFVGFVICLWVGNFSAHLFSFIEKRDKFDYLL
jgi:hypothetical protein